MVYSSRSLCPRLCLLHRRVGWGATAPAVQPAALRAAHGGGGGIVPVPLVQSCHLRIALGQRLLGRRELLLRRGELLAQPVVLRYPQPADGLSRAPQLNGRHALCERQRGEALGHGRLSPRSRLHQPTADPA
jgi:hypothetical protein